MMNQEENARIEGLARAWTVETHNLSARVASAIGSDISQAIDPVELISTLKQVQREMAELRIVAAQLQDDINRLRFDLIDRTSIRIAPYAPTERIVQLT